MPNRVSKQQYLKDPCKSLSTAYWKSMAYPVPDGIKIFHECEYDQSPGAVKYFRLIHHLEDIAPPSGGDFAFSTVNALTQKHLVAQILSECYNTTYTADFVDDLTKTRVFDPDLWIFVVEKSTARPVALGIADFDPQIKEGSLEWIQVLPEKRGQGLGKLLVNELLSRLKAKADFVTVSGQAENETNPERLYRSCGFTGNDIWYVLHTK